MFIVFTMILFNANSKTKKTHIYIIKEILKMKLNKQNKKGFTIVELVIVIAVIGILSAILIPTFANLTTNAQKAALKEELQNAYTSYIMDAADGKVGDDGAALATYSQSEVALRKEGSTEEKYYTYGANGWDVDNPASSTGARLGGAAIYYSGYEVYVKA